MEKYWMEKCDGRFTDAFWRFSEQLAVEEGVGVIAAVLHRAHTWKGEEGLIFVPLIALLPRAETTAILEHYKSTNDGPEGAYAGEFLIELEASDVEDMVRLIKATPTTPTGSSP